MCSLMLLFSAKPRADTPATAPSNEIEQALKSLKHATADEREKVYTLLADKGDASLIPALNAYKNGSLLLTDKGDLAVYGERVNIPDQGSVLPLLNALTQKPILGDDGKPIYALKPDLSNAMLGSAASRAATDQRSGDVPFPSRSGSGGSTAKHSRRGGFGQPGVC